MSDIPSCPDCWEYINPKDGCLREQCVRMQSLRARCEEAEAKLEWAVAVQKAVLESQTRLALETKAEKSRASRLEAALVCPNGGDYGTHWCIRCDSEVKP